MFVAASASEGQCGVEGGPRCSDGKGTALSEAPAVAEGSADAPLAPASAGEGEGEGEATNGTSGKVKRREIDGIGMVGACLVLSLLVFVVLWIGATIKFALDGSLPARLALWGLLPEAYAAISVTAVVALLRLKQTETPIIVLRNCVTDAGAKELAEAIRLYGKKADLQAIELPHNPRLGEAGVCEIVAAALLEGSNLQELDFSYNPQLRSCIVDALKPLLGPRASKVNTLRLADCGLTPAEVQKLADNAASSGLRTLDLSCNELGGGGEAVAAVLEVPVLEELTLTCCNLRLEDVEAIAATLPYTSLKSLQLGGNKLKAAGVRALAAHLPKSQIDELGLEGNDLEAADLGPLGSAWARRPFSRVKLAGNRMAQEEVSAFVRTLKSIN